MKLFVKEKLFSIHDKYGITDEDDNLLYYFQSKFFSIGKKTKLYDVNDNEIIYIEQELFHLMNHYNVTIRGKKAFSIKRKFHLINVNLTISNGYKVEGDLFSHDFTILNDKDDIIATINRKLLSIGDKYCINIQDEKELDTILAIIVAITAIIDESQHASASSSSS